MRIIKMLISVIIVVAVSPLSFADQEDPKLDLIEARQGEMVLRAFFLGPLVAMAKAEIPYNAEQAAKLAGNLESLGSLDMGRAWAEGTDKDSYPDKTGALANIWTTYPEVGEYGEKYDKAVGKLAKAAGNGLKHLRATIGDVGDSCKGCHDEFREKD